MIYPTTKVCEKVNRKYPAKNTAVQLSTHYRTLSATMHSVTDRQTDRLQNYAKSRSYFVQYDRLICCYYCDGVATSNISD